MNESMCKYLKIVVHFSALAKAVSVIPNEHRRIILSSQDESVELKKNAEWEKIIYCCWTENKWQILRNLNKLLQNFPLCTWTGFWFFAACNSSTSRI